MSALKPVRAITAAQCGLISCETCKLLARPAHPEDPGHCPRCGGELEFRRRRSLQRTWALVIAAAVCYIPANMLPMMATTTFASSHADTIMGGVVYLFASGRGRWP
jgi:paraquat-inducible protein A